MRKTFFTATLVAALPLFVAGCVTTTSSGGGTAATMVATQGIAPTATTLRQFPNTISGGDGFQANPTNDASFATLINAVRADASAPAVTFNAQLNDAAQKHSDAMVAGGFFAHVNPITGSTLSSRVAAEGYAATFAAENIAQGQANENQAMNGWVNSPGHQANNIDPRAREFGLGRAGTGANTTWTLVLGAQ